MQGISETLRHRLKTQIMAHEQQRILGATPPEEALQQNLFDTFGDMNRDWRRIAATEVGDAAGNGMIASLEPGTKVRRIEQYHGACPFCKKINGMVFTVVDPSKRDKDWDTEVWVGKTNIGRSGSRKSASAMNSWIPLTPKCGRSRLARCIRIVAGLGTSNLTAARLPILASISGCRTSLLRIRISSMTTLRKKSRDDKVASWKTTLSNKHNWTHCRPL